VQLCRFVDGSRAKNNAEVVTRVSLNIRDEAVMQSLLYKTDIKTGKVKVENLWVVGNLI